MGKKSKKKKPANRRNNAASGKKQGGSWTRGPIMIILVLLVAAVGVSAGLGIWKMSSGTAEESGAPAKAKLPSFVYAASAPKDAPKAYQAALDLWGDMVHIPCFCGCGKSAGHKSVRDCFVKSRNGDNISYDNHGAG